ncbi:MAG TPA: RsmE family RNA methyltransferase [Ktedonobacteraceae bacterium]|nr:RsmE family RNA methyltransferase [Ktedonobacteraceae bacterium]
MHRFFVEPTLLAGTPDNILLPDKLAHQVRDVLHLAIGESLILLDNSGDEVVATVARSNRAGVEVQSTERRRGPDEPSVRIILCQGLLKSARFEWVLEKGTELGVAIFVPTLCHRSMAGLDQAGLAKIARWQHIIQEAAEQCDRSRLPELQPIRPLAQVLNDMPEDTFPIMLWEEEHALSLHDVLNAYHHHTSTRTTTVVLFIGPEGGLTVDEVVLARQHGVQSVTLGQRTLRAETAALAAVANVMYALDNS